MPMRPLSDMTSPDLLIAARGGLIHGSPADQALHELAHRLADASKLLQRAVDELRKWQPRPAEGSTADFEVPDLDSPEIRAACDRLAAEIEADNLADGDESEPPEA